MKEKNGKPLYKKWWFWLIIILALGVFGSATGLNTQPTTNTQTANEQSEAEKEAEKEAEEQQKEAEEQQKKIEEQQKEEEKEQEKISKEQEKINEIRAKAKNIDDKIWSLVFESNQIHQQLMNNIEQGKSGLELYTIARNDSYLQRGYDDNLADLKEEIKDADLEDETEIYIEMVDQYISNNWYICTLVMDYINEPKTETLSHFQTAVALVSSYKEDARSARKDFLLSQEFNENEANEMAGY